jgi:hypothetical protein
MIYPLAQNLESKAMLKEDLNGKLLQRAELVACKEDYETVFENFNIAHPDESEFIVKESELNENIKTYERREEELRQSCEALGA